MAIRATRRVADDHHASGKQAIADDPSFTIFLARVFDLKRHAREYQLYLPGKEELRQKLEEWTAGVGDD